MEYIYTFDSFKKYSHDVAIYKIKYLLISLLLSGFMMLMFFIAYRLNLKKYIVLLIFGIIFAVITLILSVITFIVYLKLLNNLKNSFKDASKDGKIVTTIEFIDNKLIIKDIKDVYSYLKEDISKALLTRELVILETRDNKFYFKRNKNIEILLNEYIR